jgi:hypothetical protein
MLRIPFDKRLYASHEGLSLLLLEKREDDAIIGLRGLF